MVGMLRIKCKKCGSEFEKGFCTTGFSECVFEFKCNGCGTKSSFTSGDNGTTFDDPSLFERAPEKMLGPGKTFLF